MTTATITEWVTKYGDHVSQKVTVTDSDKGVGVYVAWEDCSRCGGAGGWSGWPGFTCFKCGGARGEHREFKAYAVEAFAKLEERREKAAAKKAAAFEKKIAAANAVFAEWAVAHETLLSEIASLAAENGILADFARRLEDKKTLSDKQIAFAQNLIAEAKQKIADREAASHFGEIGKRYKNVTLTTVKAVASGEGHFGHWYIFKLVTADGDELIYKGSSALSEVTEPTLASFTVKAHSEYQGKKQTLVQRVSL